MRRNQLYGMLLAKKRQKFKSIAVTVDGIRFASKLERDLYIYLKTMINKGILSNLKTQVSYPLTDAKIRFVGDFEAYNHQIGETVVYEAKGLEMPTWRIKRRLWEHYGPMRLFVYRRHGTTGLVLSEVVIPKSILKEKGRIK